MIRKAILGEEIAIDSAADVPQRPPILLPAVRTEASFMYSIS